MAMADESTVRRTPRWARVLLVLVNLAITVAIFGYLFSHVRPGDVLDLLRNMDLRAVGMFVVLSLATSLFRLWRYRVLLRLSGYDPPPFPLFLIVLVRNAFSDLLPARLGTLIDVYFFTTRLRVPFAAAASCFSITFVFEILALAPLIVLAAFAAGAAGTMPAGGLLAGGAVLLAGTVAVVALMPWGFGLAARIAGRVLPERWALRAKAAKMFDDIAGEVRRVQKAGLYGRVLALSVLLRLGKYGSLYVLLFAMLAPLGYTWAQLDLPRVFLGLCASELAASLPVSGIAGFGVYEGTWAAVFQLLGFPRDIAQTTSIAHHLFTQAYGYGLGCAALLAVLLPVFRSREPVRAATPVRDRPPVFYGKVIAVAVVLAVIEALMTLLPGGAGSRAVEGRADAPTPADLERRSAFAAAFGADLVFDSTRSGTFGIWRMRADGSDLRPVADTQAQEMYPDPSPDGRWIVFSKNVSLSKRSPGEVWICRADGSEPRKLADSGTYPTFSADGRAVYFERERCRVMAVDPAGGNEREVFPGPKGFGKYEIVKPRVSADGRRVVFVSNRGGGKSWNTWWSELDGSRADRVGTGCEPGWFPDGRRVTWVREREMKERVGVCVRPIDGGDFAPLQDDDAPRGHEYFPTVTPDGRWLLWGSCRPGEHAHTDGASNYQLFARELPDGKPVRLTFDGFNNRWAKRLPTSL